MPNSLSTHISSAVAAVLAVLTGLDKSLVVTATQRSAIVTVLVLGALVLQLAHINLKAKALDVYAVTKATLIKAIPAGALPDIEKLVNEAVADVKNQVDAGATPAA